MSDNQNSMHVFILVFKHRSEVILWMRVREQRGCTNRKISERSETIGIGKKEQRKKENQYRKCGRARTQNTTWYHVIFSLCYWFTYTIWTIHKSPCEIPFIYGTLNSSTESESSILLGEMMVDYWVSFTMSLDPNNRLGMSHPFWPQYTPENETSSWSQSIQHHAITLKAESALL
ncbi:hypothetical protein ARMGADRAFT_1032213 [Armillaria gallica]|uniref:Carboxylesterase type B domain-containing protein n=1 Tax=Armillaria gallica TaxID=47427 RepID=A0A2H3D5Y2_ARMGA|nr:hypothetical protein ARMGADRAFT_1032213 [Armillaria gallica]